ELTLMVDAILDPAGTDHPSTVGNNVADRAVDLAGALRHDHIRRLGAGYQLVVGHHEDVLAAAGINNRTAPDGADNVVAVSQIDLEVDHVARDHVIAVAEVDFLPRRSIGTFKNNLHIAGIGHEQVEVLKFSLVPQDFYFPRKYRISQAA